ncbi:MAG: tetratricopeptide repeat protein [Pirellulales bacterium]|nr:tetratricopeptide repeat protein [Pirellulales bacterium]
MAPSPLRELSEQAFDALRRGDHVRAVAIADQLAAAAPDNPVVRAIRAQALLGADAGEEAVAEARRAVELDENNEYAQRLLGLAAWRAERLTLAQQSFERALKLSGRRPELLAEYAWFMASERGPRLAEAAAQEAVAADRGSSTAWAALGLAQYRLHRREEAEASLRQALKLDPNDFYAQSAMVVLLQESRRDRQAEALADLLQDVPGTEEFIESVRREAKQRRIAKMLVERKALPEPPPDDSPRRRAMWVVTLALMIAGICLLVQPDDPRAIVICVILPLTFLWFLRRLID